MPNPLHNTLNISSEAGSAKLSAEESGFSRRLGLLDSTMVVAGSMIGSAIFIVPAEMSRQLGSAGLVLVSWIVAGLLTVIGALSYGELASMMPRAGGQYVYLSESFSPLIGFLYGWSLFLVIQTGTVAAVALGFARYFGVLWPAISENIYLVAPTHILGSYAISVSTAQLVGVSLVALLTWSNTRGIQYGRLIQNTFTGSKLFALAGIIVVGLFVGSSRAVIHENFGTLWMSPNYSQLIAGLSAAAVWSVFVSICLTQTGSLFAADAWNNITFTAGEVKNPRKVIPMSLAAGTIVVIGLYLLVNIAYFCTLPLSSVQHATSDRVAAAMLQAVFPKVGAAIMAAAIMVSTFGCINGMLLAGSRAYYAMARDGLFFRQVGTLNPMRVPGKALWLQAAWAGVLILLRTYDRAAGTYGNVYSDLLDYVVSTVLIFYVLTIAGIFRLRRLKPDAARPYRTLGYPVLPALYILGACAILGVLFCYRPATTLPGLVIIVSGLPIFFIRRSLISLS